jgi:tetrahydromethanopterin S-methyltransferase subunit G
VKKVKKSLKISLKERVGIVMTEKMKVALNKSEERVKFANEEYHSIKKDMDQIKEKIDFLLKNNKN